MGLLSFLKRDRADDAAAASAKPSRAQKASTPGPEDVQRARTRARQRLIGAVVLLAIGVIAFPIVFETQPRPIPVDLPIEIPRKDAVPPLPAPKPRATAPKAESPTTAASSAAVIDERAGDAGKEVVAPPQVAAVEPAKPAVEAARPVPEPAKPVPEPAKPVPEPVRPAAKPAPDATRDPVKPSSTTAPAAGDAARAQALLDDKAAPKTNEAAGRFIVQVGAFSEVTAARETRTKVEKLGLKTYTQVVETESGRRIRVRVGPFASRDEADKAAGRIKSAGLPSAVLGL